MLGEAGEELVDEAVRPCGELKCPRVPPLAGGVAEAVQRLQAKEVGEFVRRLAVRDRMEEVVCVGDRGVEALGVELGGVGG